MVESSNNSFLCDGKNAFEKSKINVLSTFNGLGSIWIILDRLGIEVNKRYSSEIDKYANIVNNKNYPDTIQLGDITKIKGCDLEQIDLLVGGSPCQGFSMAGKRLNFDDPRSKLFFEFVRLLKETKPKYFLLENVKMKQEYQDIISEYLGVKPIKINAKLFSAQSRERLYWTNLPINELPKNNTEVIADVLNLDIVNKRQEKILMTKSDFKVSVRKNYIDKKELGLFLREHKNKTITQIAEFTQAPKTMVEHWFRLDNSFSIPQVEYWGKLKNCLNIENDKYDKAITEFEIKNNTFDMAKRIYHIDGKHPTLTTLTGGGQRKTITDGNDLFYLMPEHCEKLQNTPETYTEGVSDRQRFKMLGNGWECKTVEFVLSKLADKPKEERKNY